jgi:hypothetical protein
MLLAARAGATAAAATKMALRNITCERTAKSEQKDKMMVENELALHRPGYLLIFGSDGYLCRERRWLHATDGGSAYGTVSRFHWPVPSEKHRYFVLSE